MNIAQIHARIREINAVSRGRALTSAESDELENLDYRRTLYLRRLPDQIERTRAKLVQLEAIYRGEAPA